MALEVKPYSATMLMAAGVILAVLGLYFVFLRPPFLPEDLRYINISVAPDSLPGLQHWLQRVFQVMGGYIFTTGLLTVFLAHTSFQTRVPGVFWVVAIAGACSIGLMVIVNFIIGSDFKWILLTFILPWLAALILYSRKK